MISRYREYNPEALFQLNSPTPANLVGGSEALSLASAVPVTPIVTGQLSSMSVANAILITAPSNQFTLVFTIDPNEGEILSFGDYTIECIDGYIIKYAGEVIDTFTLPRREYTPAYGMIAVISDGEHLTLAVDGNFFNTSIPVNEEYDTFVIAGAGGVLDIVAYWNKPVTESVISGLAYGSHSTWYDVISFSPAILNEYAEEYILGAGKHYVSAIDVDTSFLFEFGTDCQVYVDGTQINNGDISLDVPQEIVVEGSGYASVTEFTEVTVSINPLADITTLAVGNEVGHPGARYKPQGAYGVNITPKSGETLRSISFWMTPEDGAIAPGVSMTGGVLTGTGLLVNGQTYSGGVITGPFMLTMNGSWTASLDIPSNINFLHLSTSTLTTTQARALHDSFFVNPKLTLDEDIVSVTDSPVFVISASWSIVNSG